MSQTMEAQIRHLQERIKETEAALLDMQNQRDQLREALRPFAEAARWNTPELSVKREHFARAAELVPPS